MKTLAPAAFGVVFVALTTVVTMSTANASCSLELYANRVYSTGSVTSIYGTTSSVSTFSYYADTGNSMLANLLFAATAQRTKVYVTGDLAFCPTRGSLRYIGVILSAYISR